MTLTEDSLDEILDNYPIDYMQHSGDLHSTTSYGAMEQEKKKVKAAILTAHHQDIEEAVHDELQAFLYIANRYNSPLATVIEERIAQLQTKPDKVKEGE